jgi:hypothetical protein
MADLPDGSVDVEATAWLNEQRAAIRLAMRDFITRNNAKRWSWPISADSPARD